MTKKKQSATKEATASARDAMMEYQRQQWTEAEAAWEHYGGKFKGAENWPVGVRVQCLSQYPRPTIMAIEIRDLNSGRLIGEVRMSPDAWARIGTTEVNAGICVASPPGFRHEHETIEVGVPKDLRHVADAHDRTSPELAAIAAPYEIDGWTLNWSDLVNWHNHVRDDGDSRIQRATRHRYVPDSHGAARARVFGTDAR